MRKVILFLSFVIAVPHVGAAERTWKKFTPLDKSYSVEMPGEPTESPPREDDKYKTVIWTRDAGQSTIYLVSRSTYSFNPKDVNVKDVLNTLAKREKDAKLTEIQVQGHVGVLVEYEKNGLKYQQRLIMAGTVLWQQVYVAKPENFKSEDCEKFFKSLEIAERK